MGQIDRKSIRHVVHIMKDAISRGEVEKYIWVDTKNMLADVLTKESADSQALKRIFENGDIEIQIRKEEAGEDCQSHHSDRHIMTYINNVIMIIFTHFNKYYHS